MAYKAFDSNDYKNILALIGDPERVFYGEDIDDVYGHDELAAVAIMPDLVVLPLSAAEVSAVLKYANENRIPVTPRGAGTGLVGAAVPSERGIVLDLCRMNRILELDTDNLTLTVEPGVLLMELAEYTAEHGFFYPPDPGEKTATIGGNISTNAGGMRAVKYGVTRDYVRSLEVVLPDGRIIEVGGKIVKNSSGYPLMHLFIGSEGTLGIITKATLRLLPLPALATSLLVPFPSLKEAIDTVPLIMRSDATPTAVEFMQGGVIAAAENYLGVKFPDNSAEAYLLLKFDGSTKDAIEREYDSIAKLCIDSGAIDVFILDTDERNDAVWKPRGAFLEAIKASTSEMDEVDVVVPRSSINDMVAFTEALGRQLDIRIMYFGHAGDGNLHIYILRDSLPEAEWHKRLSVAMSELYSEANRLSGQVSGEHGIGYSKREYLRESLGEDLLGLMRGIKAVFDPNMVLNPNKIF